MTETTTTSRSTLGTVLFLLFAPTLFCGTFAYHFVLWFMEQIALATGSAEQLAWAGTIGLVIQAVSLSVVIGLLWFFTRDDRYRPVYAGWQIGRAHV